MFGISAAAVDTGRVDRQLKSFWPLAALG